MLPTEFTENKVRLSRFEREAYAASSLNHPNILTIYEIGHQDGHHFIATEYIDGKSLRQQMAHRLELREVLGIATPIFSAAWDDTNKRSLKQKGLENLIRWHSTKLRV